MVKSTKLFRIVHLSSAHPDRDVRIFLKECTSLASFLSDSEVHLVLAGVEERVENNTTIHSVTARNGSRIHRMWTTVNEVYSKAISLEADVYHLHDPELLRIALKLKRAGKKVIYDAHEDLPRQLLGKSYLPFKSLVSKVFEKYENCVVKKLDGVITATPFIRDRFSKIHPNVIDINNYPLLQEIEFEDPQNESSHNICYIGGITSIRGIKELVDAMGFTESFLDLAGTISEDFKNVLIQSMGWDKVKTWGLVTRKVASEIKTKSFAGIVTFLPLPNHINSQPNKIFEYMASGLPVIGSDFPMWRSLLVDNNCGICVDPNNPNSIAAAIRFLQENPILAKEMGNNGKRLVREKYNWSIEENRLIAFYLDILNP